MARILPEIERLTDKFRLLPGIGRKTAARLALAVVEMEEEDARSFAQAITDVKDHIGKCPHCGNLSETDCLCDICADETRDRSLVCVVEDTRTVTAMERIRGFSGVYHVLGGTLSPMDGIGPAQLNLSGFTERLKAEGVREVIIATNPTPDGETTALYLARMIKPLGIRTSRLAYGIPVGSDLEYADEMTLMRAMEGRREF